jgi:hypothetical protein
VNKPVAQGATLRVRVSEAELAFAQVKVNEPSVLTVQTVEGIESSAQSRITVHADAVGESKLEVTLSDAQSDYININVEAVAAGEIELFPWDSLVPLDAMLWNQGMSALPNTNLTLFGHMKSDSGQKLTGFHALEWHVETAGAASIEPADQSDFAVFKSGDIPGDNTINFGDFMPVEIPTIDANQVHEIRLLTPFQEPVIENGSILLLHAALFTAEGRYVVGIADEDVVFETDGDGVIGQLMQDADPESGEGLDLERAYRFGRATDFRSEEPGSYTVTARWKGLQAELTIDVTQSRTQPTNNASGNTSAQ